MFHDSNKLSQARCLGTTIFGKIALFRGKGKHFIHKVDNPRRGSRFCQMLHELEKDDQAAKRV